MTRLPFALLLLALTFGSGCLFSKKNKTPKENPAIASETEENFRLRYVEKRAADLVAQGLAPEAARARAVEEFRVRYSYTTAAGK